MQENYLMGYLMAQHGLKVERPKDQLFVESWIYDYDLLLEFSICAYWIGKYEESLQACDELLKKELPEHVRTCVEKNREFAVSKLPNAA
jgi:hypothetical protein